MGKKKTLKKKKIKHEVRIRRTSKEIPAIAIPTPTIEVDNTPKVEEPKAKNSDFWDGIIVSVVFLVVVLACAWLYCCSGLPGTLKDEGRFCAAMGYNPASYEGASWDSAHYVLCASGDKPAKWYSSADIHNWRNPSAINETEPVEPANYTASSYDHLTQRVNARDDGYCANMSTMNDTNYEVDCSFYWHGN